LTHTGWIGAIPRRTEKAQGVVKALIHEIIPRFGLRHTLQSNNGLAFKAAVTQGVFKALGIQYHLHCAWRLQSSGKVEKANNILKCHLRKLTQEVHMSWSSLLPTSLLRVKNTPGDLGLSQFEKLYSWPFLTIDLIAARQTAELIKEITRLASFQQTLQHLVGGHPKSLGTPITPGDLVPVKALPVTGLSMEPLWGLIPCSFVYSHCTQSR
jgi:hypothetical protein